MKSDYDVIVAGLGAAGGAIACHLARHGLRVLGLDRYYPPHSNGSSHGESRIIRAAYFEHDAYVPLVKRAQELWRQLEEQVGETLFQATGALLVGAADGGVIQGSVASARKHGVEVEYLGEEGIRDRFPVFEPAPRSVAVYEPGAGVLMVERCIAAHLASAVEAGAQLLMNEPLASWTSTAGHVEVRTERGAYRAEYLVVATGAWLPAMIPELALAVERQVMLWFAPRSRPEAFVAGNLPVFLFATPAGFYYGVPDQGRGVKVARHHGGALGTPEGLDRRVLPEDVDSARTFLRRHLPEANGELRDGVVCRYTNTPSGHFLIAPRPEEERIWVVSPCSGHGFKFAPAVGEAVAARIVGRTGEEDLAMFRWPA